MYIHIYTHTYVYISGLTHCDAARAQKRVAAVCLRRDDKERIGAGDWAEAGSDSYATL